MSPRLPRILFSWILLLGICTLLNPASAQDFRVGLARNDSPHLRSVTLRRADLHLAAPIISLGGNDRLVLRFDDLRGGVRNYQYTITHCNHDWQPSRLMVMDYLDGFEFQYIDDYRFSFGTRQGYTHYSATFPNDQLSFRASGNYILQVYEEDDTSAVLTLPFHVWENMAPVSAQVTKPNLARFTREYQRLAFSVDITETRTGNPYDEIRVVVMQNHRWDNARYDLKPRIVSGNTLHYDQPDLVFPGLKEYRYFDIRNLRLQSERVIRIEREAGGTQAYVNADENRSYQSYRFVNEIDGDFVLGADLVNDPYVEADYAMVNFHLESPFWMSDGEYHILGRWNGYRPTEENRMVYDADQEAYLGQLYLKQGYYNYMYGFVYHGEQRADFSLAEGGYFETSNQYSIFVYLHDNLQDADRLIGHTVIESFPR